MNKMILHFSFLSTLFHLLAVLFLLPINTFGGIETVVKDVEENTSYIHIDKSFYVTGEIIWYKVYLDQALKGKTATLKSVVVRPQGKIINQEFFKTEGKTYLQGYYKIPFGETTGMYLLRFTGIDSSTGTPVTIAEINIPIFNDLQGIAKLVKQDANQIEVSETPPIITNDLNVTITLPKDSFSKREAIAATIKVTDQAGQPITGTVSVAVIDKSLAGSGQVASTVLPTVPTFNEEMYIQGQVTDKKGAIVPSSIVGAFSAKDDQLYYSKVEDDGMFKMKLPDFTGEKRIQFLGDPKNIEHITVKMDEDLPFTASKELPLTDKVTNYLALSRQRKKIFQYYGAPESDIKIAAIKEKLSKNKPNQDWIIKEYENFEYMYIFFKENLSPLRFRFNSDSTYSAAMYNPANQSSDKFFSGKPLFIIDNIATRDGDFVARMKMGDIEKVELFYNLKDLNRNFKLFGSSGVVKITSYQPLNQLPVEETKNGFTVQGLQPKAQFPVFHPDQMANNRRQAFFRPQLYWNPNLTTDKQGRTTINYHQSDDRSTFQIQVVVQGENGKMGYATKEYKVN